VRFEERPGFEQTKNKEKGGERVRATTMKMLGLQVLGHLGKTKKGGFPSRMVAGDREEQEGTRQLKSRIMAYNKFYWGGARKGQIQCLKFHQRRGKVFEKGQRNNLSSLLNRPKTKRSKAIREAIHGSELGWSKER